VVWYSRISKYQTKLDKLAQVQRLGLLNIANVRQGTPTTALELAYGLEPLDLHLCELATRTYLRIGQPQGANQSGHLFKLAEMIPVHRRDKDIDSQTMIQVWEQNFKTDIAHKLDNTLGSHSYRAYSDGSLLANSDSSRVGAGVVILNYNKQHLTILRGSQTRIRSFRRNYMPLRLLPSFSQTMPPIRTMSTSW
jgi:hypothetical protein